MSEIQERKQEVVKDYLENLYTEDLVAIWNEYCDKAGYSDDYIYENGSGFLDEMFSCPSDAVNAVFYGEYSINDTYVKFDGYGNLASSDWADEWVDFDDLSEWYMDYYEEECLDLYEELFKEFEAEIMDEVTSQFNNLEVDEVDDLEDALWDICQSVGDDYECDLDELYQKAKEILIK